MKKTAVLLGLGFLVTVLSSFGTKENITFYEVPLVCGAAPEIGCGSRLKPLFIDAQKAPEIKEAWSNRQGTVVAIIWDDDENKELMQSLFKKHDIDAKIIRDNNKIEKLTVSLKNGKDRWYKGMEVDKLSMEEAGVIAETLTGMVLKEGLINNQEAQLLKKDIEAYFKKELVIVRTCDELKSEKTRKRWSDGVHRIFAQHLGDERAVAAITAIKNYWGKSCKKNSACSLKAGKSCCKK